MDLFIGLPGWYVPAVIFFFGVIIGSFLNVLIYRFHTGKSLLGSSHCLSCQRSLSWFELFPLFSYVGLGGRCLTCRAHIPSRYVWVELTAGLLFLAVTLLVGDWILWPLLFLLMALLIVIAVYDLYHLVIPNEFVWMLLVIAGSHSVYQFYLTFNWWLMLGNVLAATISFSFFAGLWWCSRGRWLGFGDAKLSVPLALMVGLGGVFSMLVLSFWIGAVLSLGLLGWQKIRAWRGQLRLRFIRHPLTIKSEVPFAPFLILGFLSVYLAGLNVLDVLSYGF
jgi:prepilin signal peptidase PulO-like enzyme (type II secretory pathway)